MDLATLKLIAFAIWTEDGGGVMAIDPKDLLTEHQILCDRKDPEAVRHFLGESLSHKFDNYLTVWGTAQDGLRARVVQEGEGSGGFGPVLTHTGKEVGSQPPAPEPEPEGAKQGKAKGTKRGRSA